ncbi:MAG: hypothetical protein RLZZ237_596 [Pseudomonadota bacterium]
MAALIAVLAAQVAQHVNMRPIASALAANNAQQRLGDGVQFFFGDQPTPPVASRLGTGNVSEKINGMGKSAEMACNLTFRSDMLALQKRAQALGADAVIHIVSNYNNVEHSSATQFECHDGAIMTDVALKGDFVKLKGSR